METIVDRSTLEVLRAGLRGTVYAPGEEGYDEARKAWNLNAHQHPALVVMAAGAADVIAMTSTIAATTNATTTKLKMRFMRNLLLPEQGDRPAPLAYGATLPLGTSAAQAPKQ